MSTYKEIFKDSVLKMSEAKVENSKFDANCLLEFCTGKDKTFLTLHGDESAGDEIKNKMNEFCRRRIDGEPLQYILGEWEFMGLKFLLGEGVLIPRPETELLVELALEKIKNMKSPVIFDLCAGTGCIGVSVAKMCKNASVYLLEKSDDAFAYLKKNIALHNIKNAVSVKADITKGFEHFSLPRPDVILSNPPYISAEEMITLQDEVRYEPKMALFGGEDGLSFYRVLIDLWVPFVSDRGFTAFECGDTQAQDVCNLASNSVKYCVIKKDLSGIDRVVMIK